MTEAKVVLTGGAGLVGQNLIPRLFAQGFPQILVLDKHAANLGILKQQHPLVRALCCDLAVPGPWTEELAGCTALVIGHAQIGGLHREEFVRNNVEATKLVLDAARRHQVPYVVNISSSVVNSLVVDKYTETKKAQEALVAASGIRQVVLRPTLMFGWFDRKHIGWLARLMKRVPIFPIPGSGRFVRQPLFAADFCDIVVASISKQITGYYNISGRERIDYIDLIRAVKEVTGAKAQILKVPYGVFWAMLKLYGFLDRNPAFTVGQLEALVTPDLFEVIDWPGIFGVRATPLQEALKITFRDPVYSRIALHF